jgi:hypothetical protein
MSDDVVNWKLLGQRLDRIQQDIQAVAATLSRQAGYQAVAASLSRHMVEVTVALEGRLDAIENQLSHIGEIQVDIMLKLDELAKK